ncbi:allophanate hydrolase [Alteromonadaceae bacterium Bs31]|nr:allophanate hydrolase [Alteromonadaceae bacterium Bs31]
MIELEKLDLTISGLRAHYLQNDFSPQQLLSTLREKALSISDNPIWIHLLSEEELQSYTDQLSKKSIEQCPLYGIPFAIKDNIDLAGIASTAACPAYSYTPETSATAVQYLIDAGAIPLGKTNMDQFATGLVGTRSPEPWGPCKNAFNPEIISGGSSSGSAIALALGLVSFSLGTDTAGSGRVPASLNNLVGLKPTRGLISNTGLVPACRSLDCISIFALNTDDANTVFDNCVFEDEQDAYSRQNTYANGAHYYASNSDAKVIAIPQKDQLAFFGMQEAQSMFEQFTERLSNKGYKLKTVNFSPFLEAAKLLYQGPWVAERWLATQDMVENSPEAMLPVIQKIIGGGNSAKATDAFAAQYKLQALKKKADVILGECDALLTPTNPRYYSIEEVEANPIELNSNMGYYTNFMNLLDYSALAIPVNFYKAGPGFGVTLFQSAFSDKKLLSIASTIQNLLQLPLGASVGPFKTTGNAETKTPSKTIDVLVCGAHLEGLPLNWQLKERGGKLLEKTHTSKHYRFYALAGGPPKRPGLQRVENGSAIEVEVWRLPAEEFGSFVNEIPAPLGIGKVELSDGRWLSSFICDSWGLEGAEEITGFGSWRNYLKSEK